MYIPASRSATSMACEARLCASMVASVSARSRSLVMRCAGAGRMPEAIVGVASGADGWLVFRSLFPNNFIALWVILEAEHGHKFTHGGGRFVQRSFFVGLELDLDNLLDAFGAEFYRDTDKQAANSVLAFEVRSARQDFFLVLQDRIHHFEHSGGRRIISRACFQQVYNFRAAFSCSGYDRFNLFLGQQGREGNPRHGGIA